MDAIELWDHSQRCEHGWKGAHTVDLKVLADGATLAEFCHGGKRRMFHQEISETVEWGTTVWIEDLDG